uniref:Cadherin domain-containing protein n=1 Tax=Timema monikensis TaxID=170555 RepID=A0A7R9E1L9_9NEOP|nr:unnamed protein product [Timema monikensis]
MIALASDVRRTILIPIIRNVGSVPTSAWKKSGKLFGGKTTLNTSDRDSNLDLPVIGSLVYCESRSLDHAVAEAGSEMAAITNCLLLATLGSLLAVNANVPLFDVSTSIRVLIVPYDARVGSAIYRLRGTDADFDFPLRFEVVGSAGGHIIHTVDIPCDKNHTFCEGDVVLSRPLERGRVYDVRLKVVDTTGDFTILDCTIRTSSRTTPTDTIFPHLPSLIEVAEDAVPGTELDYVIARNNPLNARHVSLELRGSPEFMLRRSLASKDTVKGTIILAAPLDFEKRSMYILHMFAVDPYAEPHNDTRNVASFQVAVAVRDAQDMPPVFQNVPPVTMIKHTVQPGDVVLQVHAKDGDKGQPRQVRYGLVSEENPFTTFFHINDRTGEITLSRPLRELLTITRSHQPVLLTVLAEEVRMDLHEPPAMSATVQVALLLGDLGNSPPYFENDNYGSRIDENSPQGTVLVFGDPYITEIKDDDMGKNGIFSITLENNNGTFEISPTVGERRASFVIRVRDNALLDYEMRQTIYFTIVATEVGPGGSLKSSARVTVYLNDVNDHLPVFLQPRYEVTLPENMTAGVTVAQVLHCPQLTAGVTVAQVLNCPQILLELQWHRYCWSYSGTGTTLSSVDCWSYSGTGTELSSDTAGVTVAQVLHCPQLTAGVTVAQVLNCPQILLELQWHRYCWSYSGTGTTLSSDTAGATMAQVLHCPQLTAGVTVAQVLHCPQLTAGVTVAQVLHCPQLTAGVTVAQVLHCPQLTAGVTVAQVLHCPQLTAGVTVAQVLHCPQLTAGVTVAQVLHCPQLTAGVTVAQVLHCPQLTAGVTVAQVLHCPQLTAGVTVAQVLHCPQLTAGVTVAQVLHCPQLTAGVTVAQVLHCPQFTAGVTVEQVLHCPQLTAGVTVAQVLHCPQLTAGVTVAQVRAQDLDTGLFGKVHYTRILGHLNTSLRLDSITGLITVSTNSHMFDRETAPEFRFNVEARDMEGSGNRATVPLIIKLIDVNDETPYFEKDQYDFFLTPSLRNFTTPAIITAMDMDAESPNNEVRYEIISGNYENNYYLHEIKGELTVRTSHSRGKMTRIKRLIDDQEDVDRSSITMTARAYDLGVPHRWSTTTIHVLPPDANTRTMMFIVNGSPPDRTQTLAMLETLTGGQVRIKDIRPYEGHEIQPISASGREDNEDRSMVVATILYDGTTMVDVRQLQKQLQANVKMSERVDKVGVSRAENRALFWILMILAILIVLIILLLLLCCLCPSCPLYVIPKKTSRVSSEENVQLVLKDEGPGMQTKAVQAEWMGHRREAWSADNREQQWRFNHRNNPHKNRKEYVGVEGGAILDERRGGQEVTGAAAANTLSSRGSMQEGPAIIYSRELQHLQQRYNHNREVYVEDLEGGEYHSSGQILDINQARARGKYSEDSHQFHKARYGGREDNTHRFKVKDRDTHEQEEPRLRHERARGRDANVEDDPDTDSMRQHEADRGSDLGKGRIQEEYRGIRGEYRIVIQRTNNGDEEEQEVELVDEKEISPESRREQFFIRDGNAEILRLVTRGRSREDHQYIATDQVIDTRQQQRPFTLVPVHQNETQQQQQQHVQIENGKDILMQRFIEDQRDNTEDQTPVTKAVDDNQLTSDNVTTTFNSVQQQDELIKRLLEEEEARMNNMRLLSEALAQHREQEAPILAPVEQHETQSLPGQTTMATQTDVDTSTQTEPLHLMRPPRRRTRSDNDDSFTEGEDKEGDDDNERDETIFSPVEGSVVPWVKRQKNKKRKHSRYRSDIKYKSLGGSFGKGCVSTMKRHKIKTPIMEETESALEAAEKSASNGKNQKTGNYSENKSSMLRQRNNKVKLVNVEVSSVKKKRREKHTDEVEEETPSDSLEERPNKKDSLQKRESHHGALTESSIDGSRHEVTNITVRSSRERIRRSQSSGRDDLSEPVDRSRIRDPSSHQESPEISIKHSKNYQKIRHESLDRKDVRDGVKLHDSPKRRSRDGSIKRESNLGDTIDHRRSRYDKEFENSSDIEVKRGSRQREGSYYRYNEELAEKSTGTRVRKQSRQKDLIQNEMYDEYTLQHGEYVENSPNRKIKQPFQQKYFSRDDTYENKTESRDLRNQENTENRIRQRSNERDYSRNYDYEEETSHYEPIFQDIPERRMRKHSTRAQLTPEESPERGTARGEDSNKNTRDQFTSEDSSERRYSHVENESRSQIKRSRRQGSPERRNALDEDSLRSPDNRAFGKSTRKYNSREINERGEDSNRGSPEKRALSQSIREDRSQTRNVRDDNSHKRSQERMIHGNPIIEDSLDRRNILDENSFQERTEHIVKKQSTTKYSTPEDSLERETLHRGVSYPDDYERMPKERFNKIGSKSNVNTGYNRKDSENYSESPEINESDHLLQKHDARQYSVDKQSLSLERINDYSNQTHSYRYEHADNASLNVSTERRSNEYSNQRQSSQREPSPAFTNDSLEQPTKRETSRKVKRDQTRQNKTPPQVEIKVPKQVDKKGTLTANLSSRRPSALSIKDAERRKRDRQSLSESDHTQKVVPQKQLDKRVRAKSMTQVSNQLEAPLTRRHTSLPTKGNRENSKTSSRYMGWYKNKKEEKERQEREENEKKRDEEKKLEDNRLKAMRVMRNVVQLEKDFKRKGSDIKVTTADDIGKEGKRVVVSEDKVGEFHILKVSGFEDDLDSGIAMSSLTAPGVCMKKKNQQLLEKKSVFTIAYDDVQTKQLRPDSTSPQY